MTKDKLRIKELEDELKLVTFQRDVLKQQLKLMEEQQQMLASARIGLHFQRNDSNE